MAMPVAQGIALGRNEDGRLEPMITGAHADERLVVFAVAEPSDSASPQANAIWQRSIS